jgi:hypothetical protein
MEGFKQRGFLEQGQAEDLQNVGQASFDPQFLFHDGHEHVDADGDPDLRLHGVVAGAVESFDSQMLLDPLEEQLDLPTALVELRDRERRQREVVGQEHQPSFVFGVVKRDAAQRDGVRSRRLETRQDNGLIAAESRGLVDRATRAACAIEIPLAAGDEERRGRGEAIKSLEIEVAAVHHVECPGFDRQLVEDVDIVYFPVGNVNKAGDVAAQVEQRMELDGGFAAAKFGPRKQAQAQVDRGGIERVDRLRQIDGQRFLGVQLPRTADQDLGEVGIDSPVVRRVGVGQRTPRDLAAKSGVVQLGLQGAQARFDVPQAFAEGELRESQAQELVAARKTAAATIAAILVDASVELASRQKVHELREHEWSVEHKPSSVALARKRRPCQGLSLLASSSRVHAWLNATR